MTTPPRFTQIKNPLTGKIEWQQTNNDDFSTELSISHYCDMLHDIERNEKYRLAIEKTVKFMLENKENPIKKVKALDLGTGTGLLSMFACNVDKNKVTSRGIEVFKPVAEIAEKCINLNNLKNNIEVIHCRSDDLPADKSEKDKSNLLITELFDTELIGEGCLESYYHALKHNCVRESKCYAVPFRAVVYAQLVDSEHIKNFQHLKDFNLSSESRNRDFEKINFSKTQKLHNAGPFHDFQMSELHIDKHFKPLSKPVEIYTVEFTDLNSVGKLDERLEVNFGLEQNLENFSENDKKNLVIFTWWDLIMDFDNEFVISLAPYWARSGDGRTDTSCARNASRDRLSIETDSGAVEDFDSSPSSRSDLFNKRSDIPWRDHWLQAAYFINDIKDLKYFNHDNYSCWFGQRENDQLSALWSRGRFYTNNVLAPKLILEFEKEILTACKDTNSSNESKTVMFFGDSTIIPMVLASKFRDLNFLHVYTNSSILEQDFYSKYSKELGLENLCLKSLSSLPDDEDKQNTFNEKQYLLTLGEPYFASSTTCWHDLLFLNKFKSINHFPSKFTMKACLVEFKDLYKIRYPVGMKSDLNLQPIDDIVQKALKNLETQGGEPGQCNSGFECFDLWEYPLVFRSEVVDVFGDVEFRDHEKHAKINKNFKIIDNKLDDNKMNKTMTTNWSQQNKIHAIVTWLEWTHENNKNLKINYGYNFENNQWFPGRKQTIKFLNKEIDLNVKSEYPEHERISDLEVEFDFTRLMESGEVVVNL